MNLHDILLKLLPELLPRRAQDAIKGKELIRLVRERLGDTYSDGTLRTHFSLIALEEESCLARIPGGQGYYLRPEADAPQPTLQELLTEPNTRDDTSQHRALALAIRLYEIAGLGVFAFPVGEESWLHPDLVAVHWPAGEWGRDGAYTMLQDDRRVPVYRAICISSSQDDEEGCRRAFFRALSCGVWAQEAELLIVGREAEQTAATLLHQAERFGVGLRCLSAEGIPDALPRAEELLRMPRPDMEKLLLSLPSICLTEPRRSPAIPAADHARPQLQAVLSWAEQCVARGRVEPYERCIAAV